MLKGYTGTITLIDLKGWGYKVRVYAPGYVNGEWVHRFIGYSKRDVLRMSRSATGTKRLHMEIIEVKEY